MKKALVVTLTFGIALLSVTQSFAGNRPTTVTADAYDGQVVSVAYADKVVKLGTIAGHYSLSAVVYTLPGTPGHHLKIAAVAGEFDEKVWEVPVLFNNVISVQRTQSSIQIIGEELGSDAYTSKSITITMKLYEMPDEGDSAPMLKPDAEISFR